MQGEVCRRRSHGTKEEAEVGRVAEAADADAETLMELEWEDEERGRALLIIHAIRLHTQSVNSSRPAWQ